MILAIVSPVFTLAVLIHVLISASRSGPDRRRGSLDSARSRRTGHSAQDCAHNRRTNRHPASIKLGLPALLMLARLHVLPHYIRTLGFWTGLRYWQIANRCAKNPELILDWANRCQSAGSQELQHENTQRGHHLIQWAHELRASYAAYMGKATKAQKPHPITISQRHSNGSVTIRRVKPTRGVSTQQAASQTGPSGHPRASNLAGNRLNGVK